MSEQEKLAQRLNEAIDDWNEATDSLETAFWWLGSIALGCGVLLITALVIANKMG
jgi:hypothetical protein